MCFLFFAIAAVLAAVGEPWCRFVVMTSSLALVITHHSKRRSGGEAVLLSTKASVPSFHAALAIGVCIRCYC